MTLVEEVIADVVELEVEPEDVTELMQFLDKALMDEDWLRWMSRVVFDLEPNSGKDAVKIVEMTTKHLDYYINLIVKTVAGFERIDPNIERRSMYKMLSNSIAHFGEIIHEMMS